MLYLTRCQQGNYLIQSIIPEKSTVSTVPLFLGIPGIPLITAFICLKIGRFAPPPLPRWQILATPLSLYWHSYGAQGPMPPIPESKTFEGGSREFIGLYPQLNLPQTREGPFRRSVASLPRGGSSFFPRGGGLTQRFFFFVVAILNPRKWCFPGIY